MSSWSCLLISGLALLGLSSVGIEYLQAPPFPGFAPPVPLPLRADPGAARLLDGAIDALGPPHLNWITAEVWQQTNAGPLNCAATGIYRAGPKGQSYLSLRFALGTHRAVKVRANDGHTEVEAVCQDGGTWSIQQGPEAGAMPIPNPIGLLTALREQVIFFRHEASRWQGRSVWVLTGAARSCTEAAGPELLPRQCRLVLDTATGWPYRLEWWGPEVTGRRDSLLVQVEFRNPVFNHRLDASAFTFAPPAAALVP